MADGEGQVAGRLEVLVEANLRGFARELKRKVETAAGGVNAEVGVEVDDTGLRDKLKAAVEKASAGVKAEVGAEVNERATRNRIRQALSNIASRFGGRDTNIEVSTSLSEESVAGSVAAAEELAEARPVRVPLKAKAGLWLDVLKEKFKAQQAAGTPPIEVPVQPKMPSNRSMRWVLRGGLILGLASLIQPAVGAIEQAIGGLVAMAGAAAPAVGILAGIGPALASGIQAGIGLTTAMGGVGEAIKQVAEQQQQLAAGQKLTKEQMQQLKAVMDDLSPSAQKFVKNVVGLKDRWIEARKVIQEPLFEPLNRHLKPVVNNLLPTLRDGLEGTADVFGGLIDNTASWLETKMFRRDFQTIMTQNNALLADGAGALLDIAKGMTDFMVAAGPFSNRMGDVVESAGEWFRMKMARGRRSGSIEDFLKRAGDEAGRLWRITKNLGSGIASVFRAGSKSGDRLLDSFEDWSKQWSEWAGGEGQARMRRWFNRVEPGFREIGKIVRDTGNALFKWAEDPNIVKMLRQIRTDLGPALNSLLEDLGKNLGPEVIDSITQIVRALDNLSDMHKPLVAVLDALNGVLRVLNRMMEAQPGITSAIAEIVGAFLLLKTIKTVGKGLAGLLGMAGILRKLKKGGGLKGVADDVKKVGDSAKRAGPKVAEGGKKIASGLDDAAKATSRWGKVLRWAGVGARFASRKAGPVGVALTVMDAVQWVKDSKKKYEMEVKALRQSLDKQGRATMSTIKQTRFLLGRSQVVKENQNVLGIDLDKLAVDISRFGRQGDYYKRVMEKIREARLPASTKVGVATFIDSIVKQLDEGGRKTDREARQFKQSIRNLTNVLTGKGAPKAGGGKKSPLPFDVEDLARDGQRSRSIFDQIGRWGRQMGRNLVEAGRQGGKAGKGITDGLRPVPRATRSAGEAARNMNQDFRTAGNGVKQSMNNAANNVSQGVGNMANSVRSKGPQIPAAMRTAMQALVTAVGAARGPASAAAASVAQGVKGSVQNASGGMSSIGSSMMAGLAAGISATGFGPAGPVAAAAAVTLAVAAEVRKRSETHSPSRVMERIGSFISQGLAEGIIGRERDVRRAAARLWKLLEAPEHLWHQVKVRVDEARKKAKEAAEKDPEYRSKWLQVENTQKFIRDLKQQTRRQFDALERIAGRREDVGRRLEKANNRLQNLVSARASFRSQVRGGITEYGSITGVVDANDGWATPQSVIASLGQRLGESRRFARGVKTLLNRGIGRRAYRQLLEAGVEGAGATVDALLESTPRQLRHIKELQNDIAGVGKRLGDESSGELYDAGVKAAKGLVKGLRSRNRELRQVARDTARTLVKELKKRLRIKSPSQVMAGIGHETVAGLDAGMNERQKRLMSNARRMAARLARESTPNLAAPRHGRDDRLDVARLHDSITDRRAALADRVRGRGGDAPLVGELHLHVGDRNDIPEGMREVNRTLRVIRRGGAHAFRAAGTSA